MDDVTLTAALHELESTANDQSNYFRPFLAILPVSGAAVSTVGNVLGSETLSASDDLAAKIDELQFDLGEGPCWDAIAMGRPVMAPDVRSRPNAHWPAFSKAIMEQPISSLFAFPITVGSLRLGAIDLYSVERMQLDSRHSRQATALAEAVGRHVLRHALASAGDAFEDSGSPLSRRLIHQATGMVLAQLRISSEDARLIIQGHAFTQATSMMDVAQQITDGRLVFVHTATGIEVAE